MAFASTFLLADGVRAEPNVVVEQLAAPQELTELTDGRTRLEQTACLYLFNRVYSLPYSYTTNQCFVAHRKFQQCKLILGEILWKKAYFLNFLEFC